MKKKLFILASLLMIVLVAIFTFFATMFSSDQLLKENIAAMADDPWITWLDDGNSITLTDCWMSVTEDPGSAVGLRKCNSETTSTTIYECSGTWIEGHIAEGSEKCYTK